MAQLENIDQDLAKAFVQLRDFLYTKTPIFLENGIAKKWATVTSPLKSFVQTVVQANFTADIAPIIAISEPLSAVLNAFNALNQAYKYANNAADAVNEFKSSFFDSYNFMANFVVETGGVLFSQKISTYPVKNLAIAANATIRVPRQVSVRVILSKPTAGYLLVKNFLDTNFLNAIVEHNDQGGTFSILTDSIVYTNCILESIVDATETNAQNAQRPSTVWRMVFRQPLISEQGVNESLNDIYGRLTGV